MVTLDRALRNKAGRTSVVRCSLSDISIQTWYGVVPGWSLCVQKDCGRSGEADSCSTRRRYSSQWGEGGV